MRHASPHTVASFYATVSHPAHRLMTWRHGLSRSRSRRRPCITIDVSPYVSSQPPPPSGPITWRRGRRPAIVPMLYSYYPIQSWSSLRPHCIRVVCDMARGQRPAIVPRSSSSCSLGLWLPMHASTGDYSLGQQLTTALGRFRLGHRSALPSVLPLFSFPLDYRSGQ